jgi:hypothetical protein
VLALFNMSLLPYPVWFEAAVAVLLPLGCWWAALLG